MRVFSIVTCTLAFCGLVWAAPSNEGGLIKGAVVGTTHVAGTAVKVGANVASGVVGAGADVGIAVTDGVATTLGTLIKSTANIVTTVSGGAANTVNKIPVVGTVAKGGHVLTSTLVDGTANLLLGGGHLVQKGVNGGLNLAKTAATNDAVYVTNMVNSATKKTHSPSAH